MKVLLGFIAGFLTIVVGAIFLWFVMPFVFSMFLDSKYWLSLLPFVALVPAFIFGGYVTARIVPSQRIPLAVLVGLFVGAVGILGILISGQMWFLFLMVLMAGLLSGMGGILARERASD